MQDTDSTAPPSSAATTSTSSARRSSPSKPGFRRSTTLSRSSYLATGSFNDVAGATEAYNQAVAEGVGAVYPFLGGAHDTIVGLANEDGIVTMSAGASDACERDDLEYDLAVQFDGGDYLEVMFEGLLDGTLTEGQRLLPVGEFEKVGAKFCDPTPEQEKALDTVLDDRRRRVR